MSGSDRGRLLIAATSGRALAAAAVRDGHEPIVIDLFGDLDTRALARTVMICPGSIESGFDRAGFLDAVRAAGPCRGLVVGSGFEDRPELLAAASEILPVFGPAPAVIARVKAPEAFARVLADLGVDHPPITRAAADAPGWLAKRAGGAGGGHVVRHRGGVPEEGRYLQRETAGTAVSLLVLAGDRPRLLGASRQWTDPTEARPFRYGGCAGPVPTTPAFDALAEALCGAFGLVGLISIDLLVTRARVTVLEINPRPGASLDLFPNLPLIAWHLGDPAEARSPDGLSRAAAIVHATADLRAPDATAWPDWVADVPRPGSLITSGAPICTVMARGATVAAARRILTARRALILDRLGAAHPPREVHA